MTKNRAQNKAARERMAETGESYADAKRKNEPAPYPYGWEFLDSVEKMAPAVAKYEERVAAATPVAALCEADPAGENPETRASVGSYYSAYLQADDEIEFNLTKWYAARGFKPLELKVSAGRAPTEAELAAAHALRDSGLKERYHELQQRTDELDAKIRVTLGLMRY